MDTAGQYLSELWNRFWFDLLLQSPVLLVGIAGLLWSLFRAWSYSAAAKRVALACVLLIVQSLSFAGLYGWLSAKAVEWQWAADKIGRTIKWIDGGRALILAVAVLLLISAALRKREETAPARKTETPPAVL